MDSVIPFPSRPTVNSWLSLRPPLLFADTAGEVPFLFRDPEVKERKAPLSVNAGAELSFSKDATLLTYLSVAYFLTHCMIPAPLNMF